MTSSDLGLSLTCEYNLANKTVANLVDLKLTGEITPSLYEESVVDSPNVLMRVADDQGMLYSELSIFEFRMLNSKIRIHGLAAFDHLMS